MGIYPHLLFYYGFSTLYSDSTGMLALGLENPISKTTHFCVVNPNGHWCVSAPCFVIPTVCIPVGDL